jgi:hypothetical protein
MSAGCTGRRRCTTCREWFRPDVRAGERQRVCSPECRRERRRTQAKRGRSEDLEGYRAAERVRQQEHRAKGAPGSGSPSPTGPPKVAESRAGRDAQGSETVEKILVAWDRATRRSRAGLQHALGQILGDRERLVGQAGP